MVVLTFIEFPLLASHLSMDMEIDIKSNLVQRYPNTFIKVESFERWTNNDVLNNGIVPAGNQIPTFVETYEQMLGRKRLVPDDVRRLLVLSSFLLF